MLRKHKPNADSIESKASKKYAERKRTAHERVAAAKQHADEAEAACEEVDRQAGNLLGMMDFLGWLFGG